MNKFAVLRLPNFRLLLLTRMFIMMALQSQAVIIGWQIYSLTKSTFLLGMVGLVEAIPAITCALFAGHVVDIGKPQRIYIICIGTMVLNTLLLTLLGGGTIEAPGDNLVLWIFVGVFLSGIARSFIIPASFTLLSRIVPRPELPAASAWLSSGFQVAAIGGPAIAGLIYGGYGPQGAWLFPAFLMFSAFVLVICIRLTHAQPVEKRKESTIESIKAGWKFILKNQVLLSAMSLDMFAVLFGGAVAMLPAYADQVLHVGSEGLGALRAAPAIGAIGTSLYLATHPFKKVSAKVLLIVVAGFGVCMVGFGLSTVFWVSMVFLALSGAFDSVSMVMRSTLMQMLIPDAMRGRVSSISSMFIISSNEIGAFESGIAARAFGLVPSVVLGGIGTLAVVALTATLAPKFRKTVLDVGKD